MTLACLANQSCSELGPAQPQLVLEVCHLLEGRKFLEENQILLLHISTKVGDNFSTVCLSSQCEKFLESGSLSDPPSSF